MTFGSRSGQFAVTGGLGAGDRRSLKVVYDPTDVTLVGVAAVVRVNPTSGLVTTEAGGSDHFTVVLDSQPTANVTIGLSSSNPAPGEAHPC